MNYDILFDEFPAHVFVRTNGKVSSQEIDEFLTQMTESPQWQPGTNLIIDHRELKYNHVQYENVQSFVETFLKHQNKLGRGKCAYVVRDAIGFGLLRMFELSGGDNIHEEVGIFYSMDDASKWLQNK